MSTLNWQYFVAQMYTWEDIHARLFTCAILDDLMSQSELTTSIAPSRVLIGGSDHYWDKLANAQFVINCRYSVAQMPTWEDIHARLFTSAVLDDVMSQSELTANVC